MKFRLFDALLSKNLVRGIGLKKVLILLNKALKLALEAHFGCFLAAKKILRSAKLELKKTQKTLFFLWKSIDGALCISYNSKTRF